jgi:hypothetical protein
LPEPGVTTLRGQTLEQYEVLARAPEISLAFWGDVFPTQDSTYELSTAGPLKIRVVNTATESVSGARVSVGRGALGFIQLARETNEDGVATFPAVPDGSYRVRIRRGDKRGRASIHHEVDRGTETEPVWVTLRPADAARAELPTPSEAASFGGQPPPSSDEQTDGDEDDHGADTPVETTVRLTVRGLETSIWRNAEFRWRVDGGGWQLGRLQAEGESRFGWGRQVTGSVIEFAIETDGRRARQTFQLSPNETDVTWAIRFERRVSVYVVDDSGSPVRGAKIFVWRGASGPKTMLSGGVKPRKLTVPADTESANIRLGAVRAGLGEAWGQLPEEGNQVTLELTSSAHTHAWPDRMMDLATLEEALDAQLVEIDNGVQFDPLPGGWASRKGIARGDWLISAQRAGQGALLHISHGGTHGTLEVPAERLGR